MSKPLAILAVALALAGALYAQSVPVDPGLSTYSPASGVSGNIRSVGSDTMNNLMALWSEGFKRIYPNVAVEIEGKGSSTAPPALASGTSTFGPMSRRIKDAEAASFEKKYGYKPTQLPTSIDMLAVYVHKDNPIRRRHRIGTCDRQARRGSARGQHRRRQRSRTREYLHRSATFIRERHMTKHFLRELEQLKRDALAMDDRVDELLRATYDGETKAVAADATRYPSSLRILSTAKCLERIADHSTNIAEDVIYMATGDQVKHQP